jgi:hypothetical protein
MFGAIVRRLVTGGALLFAGLLGLDAAEIDDDLPNLADQFAQMATEVALELQKVCPPASPSDEAAFDRCRHTCSATRRYGTASPEAPVGPPESGRRGSTLRTPI